MLTVRPSVGRRTPWMAENPAVEPAPSEADEGPPRGNDCESRRRVAGSVSGPGATSEGGGSLEGAWRLRRSGGPCDSDDIGLVPRVFAQFSSRGPDPP